MSSKKPVDPFWALAAKKEEAMKNAPSAATLSDTELMGLITSDDTRQILHVGYGDALTLRDSSGNFALLAALQMCLIENKEDYDQAMEAHIGKHLALFG